MRAYDVFATSLEVVVLGILRGVDTSFDTATDGFDGVAHSKEGTVMVMVCQGGHGDLGPSPR